MKAGSAASALGSEPSTSSADSSSRRRLPRDARAGLAIGDSRRETVALDHQPCGAVRQGCFDSFLRPLGMDGNIDSSGEKRRKDRDDCFGGFRQHQSDAILLLDAVFNEPQGQRRGLLEQLAERRDPIFFDYGRSIGCNRCRVPKPVGEQVAFRLGQASPPR